MELTIYYFELKYPNSLSQCNHQNFRSDVLFWIKIFFYMSKMLKNYFFSAFLGWTNLQTSEIAQHNYYK